jgi:hypothetical protein
MLDARCSIVDSQVQVVVESLNIPPTFTAPLCGAQQQKSRKIIIIKKAAASKFKVL